MSKKQFDAKTKVNYGSRMASDTAETYRRERMKWPYRMFPERAPLLERRAQYLRERGMSPLWIGSPMRAPANFKALGRFPR